MSIEPVWVIQTEDLQVGTILSFDLTDASGAVLHKAGTPISDRLKTRLQKNSIHSVTIRGATHFGSDQTESLLFDSFPSGSIESIQKTLASSRLAIRNLITAIEKNQELSLRELKVNVNAFIDQANKDIAAALAAISIRSRDTHKEIAGLVAERSSKLAFLGVITSVLDGNPPEETCKIGLAGLLHDCSLLNHPHWFSSERGLNFPAEYQQHPIESAELVKATAEVPDDVIEIISQVHEQADGSGYPHQLTLDQTHMGARVLNLADAYLTLVEPLSGKRHAPSDAIAYLCFQTAQGKFSKSILRAMLQGMSIFPIGSTVVLDDNTKAIVVKGTPSNPLEPVVRLFEPGNLRIDLAESSRSIASIFMDSKNI